METTNMSKAADNPDDPPLVMIGAATTRSVENARNSMLQVNKRTPTSLVLLNFDGIPCDITYDARLPYKEDVIFAGRRIQAGVP